MPIFFQEEICVRLPLVTSGYTDLTANRALVRFMHWGLILSNLSLDPEKNSNHYKTCNIAATCLRFCAKQWADAQLLGTKY